MALLRVVGPGSAQRLCFRHNWRENKNKGMGAKDKAAFYSSIPLQKKAFQLVVQTGYKGSLLSASKALK